MKWNMLIGSLALGACLTTPSFGGGLLDRMLGMKGCGSDSACCDTGCTVEPSCGVEISNCGPICEPTCGVESVGLGCGLSAGPSCGCEIASCDPCCDTVCATPRRRPLMELVSKVKHTKHVLASRLASRNACCDSGCAAPTCGVELSGCADGCGAYAGPTCGVEVVSCDPCGCDSVCAPSRCGGLLSKLFKRRGASCCDAMVCDSGCGSGCNSCGSSSVAPLAAPSIQGDAAPMPPAPIVDPSAYLQSKRRVIQATSYVR